VSDLAASLDRVDSGDQLGAVLALPDHLRDALWRVESASLERHASSGLIVCGMGGSAIGGDLAAAALGDRQQLPIAVVRSYELPPWTPLDRTALFSSYSGNTEETIACYAAAEAVGARRIAATTGGALAEVAREDGVPVVGLPAGLQPRAAVGYAFAVAAEVAALCGAGEPLRTEIAVAAAHLEQAREGIVERAGELAEAIGDAIPLFYGCDLTASVAYRWKCQVNECAKLPAFANILPELDHNEIVGWDGAGEGEFAAVFLEDRDQHPRERERFELTASLIAPGAAHVARIETEGETRTERLLRAVMLGDLVSLHMAARRGVDPTPVQVIEQLKDRLGRP
jgi:glucose/mannose-6-phosphate isomerase